MMIAKLRVARATNQLKLISEMYRTGLDLFVLGSFKDHAGFDGVILGKENSPYHFEFTQQAGFHAPHSHSAESLIVFYIPDAIEWENQKNKMLQAGFKQIVSHNPYWDQNGCTLIDPEDYRIVLCKIPWTR